MGIVTIKLPDVGEGIAEAELVVWNVKAGELVAEDQVLAAVMTDKATVEIPSPVTGKVIWLGGEIGQLLAIGSELARIEVDGVVEDHQSSASTPVETAQSVEPVPNKVEETNHAAPAKLTAGAAPTGAAATRPALSASGGGKPLASPSVRQAARSSGIDLRYVRGSGPAGRITHTDLDKYSSGVAPVPAHPGILDVTVRETRVVGLRRKIAKRMANAKRRIPHITIIEEVDMTASEALREQLNAERRQGRPKLTVLPFLMAAISYAVKEQPAMNAHFDDDNEMVREFAGVHIGIATQTKGGLMVPVVRHCERRSLWDCASELARVAEAARDGSASRTELSGSTITISSLGPLGAIATTPIINHPEVAIVGVNRMDIRPKWSGTEFAPRKMMNLSSSFDHRVIDGWEAAVFVKRLKTLLETPALIFVER